MANWLSILPAIAWEPLTLGILIPTLLKRISVFPELRGSL
jgi:hypothetical protein